MTVTYFRRFRMQYDLSEGVPPVAPLPSEYQLMPWNSKLLAAHAEAKYNAFRLEMDSSVFPCLGDADGCLRLMKEISCRQSFIPEATWLIQYQPRASAPAQPIGTIQGIREQGDVGSIQNIGIVPAHRGHGLGTALLQQSLAGFDAMGVRWVTLEVTAYNIGAIRLYERLGFRPIRTVYKSVDLSYGI